jgi:adenylosuccinate synthase
MPSLEDEVTELFSGSFMIIGGQWGDEGKGKVVDLLAPAFAAVVRYNGGNNAGHTVRFADRRFALHLIPSGITHPDIRCLMASGMVVDPQALLDEMDALVAADVTFEGRLLLSERVCLVVPSHRALDGAREAARQGSAIGTTGRGIGPAYQDVAQRRALRAYLLQRPEELERRARQLMAEHNQELELLFGAVPVDVDTAVTTLLAQAERLAPLVTDVGLELDTAISSGQPVLFEGAQGVLLDLIHGTYPYVTSSSCLPASASVSCGIGPSLLGPVLGVLKAYVTRVGGGPFPTELDDAVGERIRTAGAEFGTTTGRPRRCGWFDAVAARYAVRTAGIDAIALTKMDVLDGFDEIRIATAYRLPDGQLAERPPTDPDMLSRVVPVYETLDGWSAPTKGLVDAGHLPSSAEAYLNRLEELIGVPIVLVSTGPCREETMVRHLHRVPSDARALLERSVTAARSIANA